MELKQLIVSQQNFSLLSKYEIWNSGKFKLFKKGHPSVLIDGSIDLLNDIVESVQKCIKGIHIQVSLEDHG
jgi:hypothetical protein